jgi:hypothetical protein
MKATGRALVGVAIAAGVPLLYFTWWAKSVEFGKRTWPCWVAIGLGTLVAAWAVLRPPAGAKAADRAGAGLCLALSMGVGGLFGWYERAGTYELPAPVFSQLDLGRPLPSVTLVAADGSEVNLLRESRAGRFKDRKLLLSFFRGHW